MDESSGAITPPIHTSSTFERGADLEYPKGFVYARTGNPTRKLLEDVLANIETPIGQVVGEALSFSSGVAAAQALFQALPQGHVVLADDVYHGNRALLFDCFEAWGMEISICDMSDVANVADVIARNDRENILVWAETPSNPLLKVTDVEALAKVCKNADVPLVVDATWLTPWISQPFALGVDMIVHSTTKYFGGHSDLTGGAIVCSSSCSDKSRALFEKARTVQTTGGATPSAFDCWLTLRGLRTLAARVDLHCRNAMAVAEFLESHPRVRDVYYPGLVSNSPGHEIMRRQNRATLERFEVDSNDNDDVNNAVIRYGGMVSFTVDGSEEDAVSVVGKTRLFKRATSLGGTESLIEHRRSVEDAASTTPDNLIRLSVGIESERDILGDLRTALD